MASGHDIIYNQGARSALARGINALADAASQTLGPGGRNVVITHSMDAPMVTKAGATIAKAIEIPIEAMENFGADLIKEVSSKTKDSAGDGSKTASVLGSEIIKLSLESASSGSNPASLKKGIDKTVASLVEELEKKATSVKGQEEKIVPGGGAAYVHLSTLVPGIKEKFEDADERVGADIVQKAIVAPAKMIAQNAGVDGEVAVEKVKESEWEIGYNAVTGKYQNLVEAGVVDPVKVVRSALENAASAAGTMLTT